MLFFYYHNRHQPVDPCRKLVFFFGLFDPLFYILFFFFPWMMRFKHCTPRASPWLFFFFILFFKQCIIVSLAHVIMSFDLFSKAQIPVCTFYKSSQAHLQEFFFSFFFKESIAQAEDCPSRCKNAPQELRTVCSGILPVHVYMSYNGYKYNNGLFLLH